MTTVTTTGSLSIDPKALADTLKTVRPAIGRRSAVEALSGVRVRFDGHIAFLHATDMDVHVRRQLPARGLGEIDAVVPFAELEKAAKALAKADEIALSADEENLTVAGGRRTIKLRLLRLADFPELPPVGQKLVLGADGAEFATAVKRIDVFASKDETRPILTGIRLDGTNGESVLVATDSYRLGVIACPGILTPGTEVTLPARLLTLATKGAKAGHGIGISQDGRWIMVRNDALGEFWWGRAIEGQYPSWRQLIPETFDNPEVAVRMATADLLSAAELACQFAQRNAPMRLAINGKVTAHGTTPDRCSFEEEVPATIEPAGGELEIGFNPEFMRDIAKVVAGEHVELRLITPLRPGLIVDGDDRFLLMPIRLNV